MTVSIAMTTYNGEKYIEKQLLSLLEQEHKPDEVIIADDRSTDNTVEIIKCFINAHNLNNWSVYVNDINLGFIDNFKKVISKTKGDIIFLCDQDDMWHKNKIEKLCILFDEHPDAIAINSGFQFIDGEDNMLNQLESKKTSNNNTIKYYIEKNAFVKIDYSTIIKYNISPGCTMAFRSILKDKLTEKTGYTIPHDWHINLLACAQNGLYFYNSELIDYRIHSSNTIGMSTTSDKPVLKIQGDFNKRLKVLECMQNLYGLLSLEPFISFADKKEKKFIKKSEKFASLRADVLQNRKLSSWFRLIIMASSVYQKGIYKMVLGDLVFMLRLHK